MITRNQAWLGIVIAALAVVVPIVWDELKTEPALPAKPSTTTIDTGGGDITSTAGDEGVSIGVNSGEINITYSQPTTTLKQANDQSGDRAVSTHGSERVVVPIQKTISTPTVTVHDTPKRLSIAPSIPRPETEVFQTNYDDVTLIRRHHPTPIVPDEQ